MTMYQESYDYQDTSSEEEDMSFDGPAYIDDDEYGSDEDYDDDDDGRILQKPHEVTRIAPIDLDISVLASPKFDGVTSQAFMEAPSPKITHLTVPPTSPRSNLKPSRPNTPQLMASPGSGKRRIRFNHHTETLSPAGKILRRPLYDPDQERQDPFDDPNADITQGFSCSPVVTSPLADGDSDDDNLQGSASDSDSDEDSDDESDDSDSSAMRRRRLQQRRAALSGLIGVGAGDDDDEDMAYGGFGGLNVRRTPTAERSILLGGGDANGGDSSDDEYYSDSSSSADVLSNAHDRSATLASFAGSSAAPNAGLPSPLQVNTRNSDIDSADFQLGYTRPSSYGATDNADSSSRKENPGFTSSHPLGIGLSGDGSDEDGDMTDDSSSGGDAITYPRDTDLEPAPVPAKPSTLPPSVRPLALVEDLPPPPLPPKPPAVGASGTPYAEDDDEMSDGGDDDEGRAAAATSASMRVSAEVESSSRARAGGDNSDSHVAVHDAHGDREHPMEDDVTQTTTATSTYEAESTKTFEKPITKRSEEEHHDDVVMADEKPLEDPSAHAAVVPEHEDEHADDTLDSMSADSRTRKLMIQDSVRLTRDRRASFDPPQVSTQKGKHARLPSFDDPTTLSNHTHSSSSSHAPLSPIHDPMTPHDLKVAIPSKNSKQKSSKSSRTDSQTGGDSPLTVHAASIASAVRAAPAAPSVSTHAKQKEEERPPAKKQNISSSSRPTRSATTSSAGSGGSTSVASADPKPADTTSVPKQKKKRSKAKKQAVAAAAAAAAASSSSQDGENGSSGGGTAPASKKRRKGAQNGKKRTKKSGGKKSRKGAAQTAGDGEEEDLEHVQGESPKGLGRKRVERVAQADVEIDVDIVTKDLERSYSRKSSRKSPIFSHSHSVSSQNRGGGAIIPVVELSKDGEDDTIMSTSLIEPGHKRSSQSVESSQGGAQRPYPLNVSSSNNKSLLQEIPEQLSVRVRLGVAVFMLSFLLTGWLFSFGVSTMVLRERVNNDDHRLVLLIGSLAISSTFALVPFEKKVFDQFENVRTTVFISGVFVILSAITAMLSKNVILNIIFYGIMGGVGPSLALGTCRRIIASRFQSALHRPLVASFCIGTVGFLAYSLAFDMLIRNLEWEQAVIAKGVFTGVLALFAALLVPAGLPGISTAGSGAVAMKSGMPVRGSTDFRVLASPRAATPSLDFSEHMRHNSSGGVHARMRANSHPFSLTVVSYWRLFDHPGFEALTVAVFCASFGAFNTILHMSTFAVEAHNFEPQMAALFTALIGAGFTVGILSHWLIVSPDTFFSRFAVTITLLGAAACGAIWPFLTDSATEIFVAISAVLGVCLGSVTFSLVSTVRTWFTIRPQLIHALNVISLSIFVGAAGGPVAVAAVYELLDSYKWTALINSIPFGFAWLVLVVSRVKRNLAQKSSITFNDDQNDDDDDVVFAESVA